MRIGTSTRQSLIIALLALLGSLTACGRDADLTCDEPRRYQQSVEHARLKTPEDLDTPQAYLEMPVPQANPAPERPKGSPCLDLPPRITSD